MAIIDSLEKKLRKAMLSQFYLMGIKKINAIDVAYFNCIDPRCKKTFCEYVLYGKTTEDSRIEHCTERHIKTQKQLKESAREYF